MGGLIVKNQGSFKKTLAYFVKANFVLRDARLEEYGKRGVEALRSVTPADSGETADSWDYVVVKENHSAKIIWTNDKVIGDEHVPLAILLQYGHAAKDGYWIEGLDYINPALRPIFEEIAKKLWKEASEP